MTYPIPKETIQQNIVALGKTGAGKSSALRSIAEPMLDEKLPICIIDPKGDWWGLKLSADGKRPGYPLVIFGGKHADVPINEHSGAHIAELFAQGNRPCIIDLRGWMPAARSRFFVDFASTLFQKNAGRRWVIVDEIHNFAPKGKVLDPLSGVCLHWAIRLASEGRGLGVNMIGASQRPQKVHNDFLTSCETLIAMRVLHASDRGAYKDWIDGCGDPAKGKEMLSTIANLKRGTGFVWSPEIEFGPELVKFPMFRTYDSFKPQEEGREAKLTGWAEVNLDEVKAKLANVVQEAEANDPKLLKARIAELEKQLRQPKELAIDVEALRRAGDDGYKLGVKVTLEHVAEAVKVFDGPLSTIQHAIANFADGINVPGASPFASPQWSPVEPSIKRIPTQRISPDKPPNNGITMAKERPKNVVVSDEAVGSGGKRRILTALAQNPGGITKRKLSILVDIAPKGGTWRTYMADLRSRGWIDGSSDRLQITSAGLDALGDFEPLPTGDELVQYWRQRLGDSGKRAIFDRVVAVYPKSIPVDRVSELTNIARSGGTWRTYMAELRGLGIIEGRDELRASEDLF